jgi:hypothetical protein
MVQCKIWASKCLKNTQTKIEMVIVYMKRVDFEAIPRFKVLGTRVGSKHLKT